MKTALFVNFTNDEFIGYWDGKGKKFAPGQSLYMPLYLAEHFAMHLLNQELQRKDGTGELIYKNGEKMLSPKRKEDFPEYMQLWNKAVIYEEEKEEQLGQEKDDIDSLINSVNKNKSKETAVNIKRDEIKQTDKIKTKSEVNEKIFPPDNEE